MEKLKLKSISSQAKVLGTLVSIIGALIVVLYNGPLLITDVSQSPTITLDPISNARSNWILGGALNAACYVVASFWYIFQGKLVIEYPAEFVLVFVNSFFALVLAVPVGIASEPHLSSWKVPLNIRFFSILYSGIMGSGYGIMIHTWGIHVKGPVYVALFRPLSITIAAILGVIFLGDDLYLGTVIGSVVITTGFYAVVWGKHKEEETGDASSIEDSMETSRTGVPLLKHRQV